ncbi:MAG: hypothetical protein ACRDOS_08825 [Gaiellaceae bacterium]
MTKARRLVASVLATAAMSFTVAAPAAAQPPDNQAGDSLVNVQIGDITVLAPIGVAANLCDVQANVLAEQVRTGDATCEATAESIATPGPGNGNGPDNQAGDSLVNVQIGDITVKLPIATAANVCDVNVNVLAQQLRTGEATCEAVATSEA